MNNQASPRIQRHLTAAAPLLVVIVLSQSILSGNQGCGTKDQQETLASPVQALATVYQHPDGIVEAELVLISTRPNQEQVFIDSASEVELRVEGKSIQMAPATPGRWVVSSRNTPELTFAAGTRYLFRFKVDDPALAGDEAGNYFLAEVEAIDTPINAVPVAEALQDYTLELNLEPSIPTTHRGVVRVYGPDGALTHSNFDLTSPRFDGSKHASLIVDNKTVLPAKAFPVAGEYIIRIYHMNYNAGFDPELSAELGVLSGFLAGSGADLAVTVK